jgi:P-type Ca2+ transporter type 2C
MTTKEQCWHNFKLSKIFANLKSSKKGLTSKEVKQIRKRVGLNTLPAEKPLRKLRILLMQLKSPLVYILLIASLISLFLGHITDAVVIFFVVVINTIFGFWQEYQAGQTMDKLKKVVTQDAKVLRNGREVCIGAEKLVPGDIIFLESGDKVPADARLITSNDLEVIEASLTGESAPVTKGTNILDKGVPLAERVNMVYMGTNISLGKGTAMVCCTGINTEIGEISKLLKETKEDLTPLQYKLAKFTKWLTIIILIISALIFVEGIITGKEITEMFLVVVAIAVAAIPEGLLVAVTIVLTVGMQYILKRKALVKRLVAAETLGSVSIICTDKTGTLTEGEMRVSKIITADRDYEISKVDDSTKLEKVQDLISKVSMLCTSAVIENPDDELKNIKVIGSPTERALLLAAIQSGFDKDQLDREYKKQDEIPFDSERKYMATLHSQKEHQHIFVKGAPEKVFDFCDRVMIKGKKEKMTKQHLAYLNREYEKLTSKGLRLLGFAYKTGKFDKIDEDISKMVFLGFIAVKDPLRAESKATIRLCRRAGIRPIIITGDHRLTAKAIFDELGLKTKGKIAEGKDLDKWSDEELKKRVTGIDIYARVEPRHKLRVVDAWQARGEVVAMTGDGINDAPALKSADIGVAFGSGSDVTKETADIILLDNNFKVIIDAVKRGRIIFDNIRKIIVYLLSDSFSEMILIAGALILGAPIPILATQILWINLVADGLPNIALTMEPGEDEVMTDKPRSKNEPLLNREMKILIFVIGIVTDVLLLGVFFWLMTISSDMDYIRTIIFMALGIDSLLYVFSVRSFRKSLFTKNFFSNKYLVGAVAIGFLVMLASVYIPFMRGVFHTVVLGPKEWALILGLGILQIILIEAVKHYFIVRHQNNKKDNKNKLKLVNG